jgi:Ribonuclease G/E
VCGRHGEKEKRLTWGDLVVFPMRVFMPQGRRAGGISEAIRQRPKGLSEARREVRVLVVVRKRRESGVTCAIERRAREEPKGISLDAKRGHEEGAKRSLSR